MVWRDGSRVEVRSGFATAADYRDYVVAGEWRSAVLASTGTLLQQHVVSSEDGPADFPAKNKTRERSGSRDMGRDHRRVAGYRVFLVAATSGSDRPCRPSSTRLCRWPGRS